MRGKLILFAGVAPRGVSLWRAVADTCEPRALLVRRWDEVACAVLFSDAIAALDPVTAPRQLRHAVGKIVLSADTWRGPLLRRFLAWHDAGFVHLSPIELTAHLERMIGWSARPQPDIAAWSPRPVEPGSHAERVLDALAGLSEFSVENWARELRCGRRTLHRWCSRMFGEPPHLLVDRVRLAIAHDVRGHAGTMAECAAAAGYSEPRCLDRLLRRRGEDLGPRRGGARSSP